jgi:ABC-type enterobactin transport system permease subunit
MGLMMICCGMAVQRMGMLELGVRKTKALSVKMERVTVIGAGR